MCHRYAALLRAVNVGGSGRLPMADLVALCRQLGFREVATYIQSGNLVFQSSLAAAEVSQALAAALERFMRKPVGLALRTPSDFEEILGQNPWPDRDPKKVVVYFLNEPISPDSLPTDASEELHLCASHLYIYYPEGQGRSRLRLPSGITESGTARNWNTVLKVAQMLGVEAGRFD